MPLSEIKSYVVALSVYINMIKIRTLQVPISKHSIKKDMIFSLGQIEIILVGQGGILPPLGYASASASYFKRVKHAQNLCLKKSKTQELKYN